MLGPALLSIRSIDSELDMTSGWRNAIRFHSDAIDWRLTYSGIVSVFGSALVGIRRIRRFAAGCCLDIGMAGADIIRNFGVANATWSDPATVMCETNIVMHLGCGFVSTKKNSPTLMLDSAS